MSAKSGTRQAKADIAPVLAFLRCRTPPRWVDAAVERFERLHIERILRQTPDKREAAKRLGIGLSSLYRKIEQYGVAVTDR